MNPAFESNNLLARDRAIKCNTLEHMKQRYDIPIAGVSIGHATDSSINTGVTVCLFDAPAVTAMHIMGAAPGTRDTELLNPEFTVDEVDALVLSGGSAFGLDAASGVQASRGGSACGKNTAQPPKSPDPGACRDSIDADGATAK